MKVLMWLAFFGLVIAALYAKKSSAKIGASRPLSNRQFDDAGAELMLRCAHCGVYVPSSESIHHGEAVYCCENHRSKHAEH